MTVAIGCVPVYDDAALARGAVASLWALGLSAVVADGPWPLFDGRTCRASDGFGDAFDGFDVDVVPTRAWSSEANKRTALAVAAGKRARWGIFLDADERLETRQGVAAVMAALADAEAVGATWCDVNIYRPDHIHDPDGFRLPRILRLAPDLHFRPPRDFEAYRGSTRIAFLDGEPGSGGGYAIASDVLRIRHERRLRDSGRAVRNGEYQQRRRAAHGV